MEGKKSCEACYAAQRIKNNKPAPAPRPMPIKRVLARARFDVYLPPEVLADYTHFCEEFHMPFDDFVADALECFVEGMRLKQRQEEHDRIREHADAVFEAHVTKREDQRRWW